MNLLQYSKCTVKYSRHWKNFLRKAVESPSSEIPDIHPEMDPPPHIALGDPSWAVDMDYMTPRGSFHPKLLCSFCDAVGEKNKKSDDNIRTTTMLQFEDESNLQL